MSKAIQNRALRLRTRRHTRIRFRVRGTADRPRLPGFRSNHFMYAQLIDDTNGKTIAAASTKDLKGKTMLARAAELGKTIGDLALGKKMKKVVFDRGGYVYTGRIKAIADGARAAGLIF